MELMFCKHQDVLLQLRGQLINSFLLIFYWISLEWWILLGFLKTNSLLPWRISSAEIFFCFFPCQIPPFSPIKQKYESHSSYDNKNLFCLYTPPSSKSRDAKSIMHFLWVDFCLNVWEVYSLSENKSFFSLLQRITVTFEEKHIPKSQIYLLKMIIWVLQHQFFF